MVLTARVARRQNSSNGPSACGKTGLGLRLVEVEPQYLEFVKGHLTGEFTPYPEEPEERLFQVRVIIPGTESSRLVTVRALNDSDAKEKVLWQLEIGWEIAEVR